MSEADSAAVTPQDSVQVSPTSQSSATADPRLSRVPIRDGMKNRPSNTEQAAIRAVAYEIIDNIGVNASVALESVVAERIASLVTKLVGAERERCVRLCQERAELWKNTAMASMAGPRGREESRARGNEASYLADLLVSP
jgi:hypothetical protein